MIQIWKAAKELEESNASLEKRVNERTKELQESQQIILGQQQFMVASAKMSALGEMAGGVAHEINTPLAIISLRAEQLEESIQSDDFSISDISETLKIIRETTIRIAKIVKGLKSFARDGSKTPTQLIPIHTLIEDTVGFCQESFTNRGVRLDIILNKDCENEKIECRPVELSQVLLNLLNNAFDAIHDLPDKWIQLKILATTEHFEISVTDSGRGIPKEIQEKIMQPFFTTKEVGKGTGLGLSISKGIIDSHHGRLYIENASAHTQFVIEIPKVQPTQTIGKTA